MTREIAVRNPRTGAVDYRIEPLDRPALADACARLRAGQAAWEALGVEGRAGVLRAFTKALDRHRDAIIGALCADTGRYEMSVIELEALKGITEERCGGAAAALEEARGDARSDATLRFEQQYVPYELVGIISPWNYPLILAMLDAIPALLAGSAVAIKPSEVTPRFIRPLRAAIAEVPELAAVLEVFEGGAETGEALVDLTDTLVFTGSVRTGRLVHQRAASQFKTVFLELGGNDAAVVLASADPDKAAEIVVRGSVENAGQLCCAIERVYVHESLRDAFLDRLCERVRKLSLNHSDIRSGDIGPIIFEKQAAILREHLDDARAKGARILVGGEVKALDGGLWCEPTVLVDVDHSMRMMQEETFGPIIPVMPFSTEEEAVRLANETEFGLSATVIGAEGEALKVGRRLRAGGVWINDFDTMGGVGDAAEKNAFGVSGLGGTRYGPGGFRRFVRKKALVVRGERPSS